MIKAQDVAIAHRNYDNWLSERIGPKYVIDLRRSCGFKQL
jgi:hypothetical protein